MVKDIKQDDRLRIIINSVAKMAKELKIKVVAEYISDEKVFEIVKNKNVDYFQGYYIGKPNKRLINENSCS
jgi:EAL domain-containing protein (putative c-di-GMP-specific phosphodiesterase class I)